jgi:hypothetical protein
MMVAAKQLLVSPIMGLMPKYNEIDLNQFIKAHKIVDDIKELDLLVKTKEFFSDDVILDFEEFFSEEKKKSLMISLANLLWKIELEDKDRKTLANSLKKNKTFIESASVPKEYISEGLFSKIDRILQYKYMQPRRLKK